MGGSSASSFFCSFFQWIGSHHHHHRPQHRNRLIRLFRALFSTRVPGGRTLGAIAAGCLKEKGKERE